MLDVFINALLFLAGALFGKLSDRFGASIIDQIGRITVLETPCVTVFPDETRYAFDAFHSDYVLTVPFTLDIRFFSKKARDMTFHVPRVRFHLNLEAMNDLPLMLPVSMSLTTLEQQDVKIKSRGVTPTCFRGWFTLVHDEDDESMLRSACIARVVNTCFAHLHLKIAGSQHDRMFAFELHYLIKNTGHDDKKDKKDRHF